MPLTPQRLVLELAVVMALVLVGSLLGALTGVVVLSPILGMVLPLLAATAFLRRDRITWRDVGFPRAMPFGRFLKVALGCTALAFAVTGFVVAPLLRTLGLPPPDTSILVELIERDTLNYLLFLIPVAWGSAAFGEELLLRGFVLHRLTSLLGSRWGVVLQALLFALGHAYQGPSGVLTLFVVGLVFGFGYLRAGRNLWPVITAHGLIDTVSITLLYLGYGQAA